MSAAKGKWLFPAVSIVNYTVSIPYGQISRNSQLSKSPPQTRNRSFQLSHASALKWLVSRDLGLDLRLRACDSWLDSSPYGGLDSRFWPCDSWFDSRLRLSDSPTVLLLAPYIAWVSTYSAYSQIVQHLCFWLLTIWFSSPCELRTLFIMTFLICMIKIIIKLVLIITKQRKTRTITKPTTKTACLY